MTTTKQQPQDFDLRPFGVDQMPSLGHLNAVAQEDGATRAINRKLAAAGEPSLEFTNDEKGLVERVREALTSRPEPLEYDLFISYARIDGEEVAEKLKNHLESLGVTVWFDREAIRAGKSQALQMDRGLLKARAGVVLLTHAYLAGRFWTERELGPLLGKSVVIPVLHNVTFAQVAKYSPILSDLAGFETSNESLISIAGKVASAVLTEP